MHRVLRLDDVEVFVPVDSVVARGDEPGHILDRRVLAEQLQHRRITLVEKEVVEVGIGTLVRHLAELGRDETAAEDQSNVGMMAAHVLRNLEGADQGAGERTRHADDGRPRLRDRLLEVPREGAVHHAPAADQLLDRPEVRGLGADAFGVAGKAETRVDLVADLQRQLVNEPRGLDLVVVGDLRRRQELKDLLGLVAAVVDQDVADDLDREVPLKNVKAATSQEPRQVHRRRIRRVRLHEWRSQQEKSRPHGMRITSRRPGPSRIRST